MHFDHLCRRIRPGFFFILCNVLAAMAGAGWADEPTAEGPDELSADRPDFTESTATMRPGLYQLEGGLHSSSHALASGALHTIGGPYPLLRLGVTPRVELRLGADGFQSEARVADGLLERQTGRSDFDVSVKIRLWDQRRGLPAFAIIPGVSLPAGSPAFSSGGRDPFLQLCWSKELGRGFDAGGNANFGWDRGEAQTLVERGYSLSVGHNLPAGVRGFGEIYRISPIPDDERAHWIADAGVSKTLGRNFEMDLAIGHTVMAQTPAWIFSVGFAVRGSWRFRR